MNDVNEFWWFYDRIAEYLETHDDVPQFIAEHVTHFITRRGTRQISICAMCFSEDGDDASQWDRYALNGNGVAVGIDTERLKSIDRTEFQRVCYDPDKQVDFINKVVSELSRKYPNGTDSIGNVCDPLSRIAAGCKNRRFGAEKEWRLIGFGCAYTAYEFRARNDAIVPFVRYPVPQDAITEIRLGQKASQNLHTRGTWSYRN